MKIRSHPLSLIVFFLFWMLALQASPLKAVIFDYGGVLAEIDRKPLLHFLSDSLEVPYKQIKRDFARDRLYQSFEKPLSFWEAYAEKGLPPNWRDTLQFQIKEVVHPNLGMDILVEHLKGMGLRVAILSNTEKARSLFLKSVGSYHPFPTVVLSCDAGVSKPDPKIYLIVLKELDLEAKNCLFIDDKKRNVDAAKKLGMDGIVFRSREQLIEELKMRGITLP